MRYKEMNYKINEETMKNFISIAKDPNGYDRIASKYSRIKMLDVNSSLLDSDPLFAAIKQNYNNFLFMIYKSPPFYQISYHLDPKRHFGFNIALSEPASIYFGECDDEYFDKMVNNKKLPTFWNIEKYDYKVGVPVVVNTKVYHSTINLTDVERYMLTFTIGWEEELTMENFLLDIEQKSGLKLFI